MANTWPRLVSPGTPWEGVCRLTSLLLSRWPPPPHPQSSQGTSSASSTPALPPSSISTNPSPSPPSRLPYVPAPLLPPSVSRPDPDCISWLTALWYPTLQWVNTKPHHTTPNAEHSPQILSFQQSSAGSAHESCPDQANSYTSSTSTRTTILGHCWKSWPILVRFSVSHSPLCLSSKWRWEKLSKM